MESSNAKSFFGVPISQVQSSNYAYVPATNSSNSIEEQSTPRYRILCKHLYSTKLNLTYNFFTKTGFFVKTKEFSFSTLHFDEILMLQFEIFSTQRRRKYSKKS